MKTLNGKLGLLLALLGLGALVIGNPGSGGAVTIDPQELARLVQTETDHVSPEELADWIVQGKSDFRLIDLRSDAEYAAYHIPGAENVLITALDDYGLLRNEKIILYSEGGIHSAQAWFLLQAKGYRAAYLLRGGLEGWKEEVLFPHLPDSATSGQAAVFEKRRNVSRFFGGTPSSSGAPTPEVASGSPNIVMPSAPAAGGNAAGGPKKKKKEGC